MRNQEGAAGGVDSGLRLRMQGEERRIESQHERLNDFCGEVYVQIDKEGARGAINDFLLFSAALDAHMTVEDDIYFPAFHGLRPDAANDLSRLAGEHGEIRAALEGIKRALKRNDASDARQRLDSLARHISEHERAEEELIARITDGPVAAGSGASGL